MGGKAFENITRRINLNEIHPTLVWLEEQWPDYKLNNKGSLYNCRLGSAGKNETSGDIDLNLKEDAYDQHKVADQLKAFLGEDHVKPRPGNNQIFTAVPILGDPANGYVQIDFMFGDFDWQEFSYWSPGLTGTYRRSFDTSQLKGLYRTELIKALVAFNSDWVLEENGEMIARVGPTFFHDKGCVWRYRYRPMRRDGTARVKEFKEVSKEEFLKLFPSATPARTDVIKDPQSVVTMLFSDYYTPEFLQTFESLVGLIRRNYEAEDRKTITKIYLERLNSLKADIPHDVFRYSGLKVK